MAKKICLTGIRASGEIHLGNYLGAMKPAIERQEEYDSYFFVANLHGLTTHPKAEDLQHNALSISAVWLAIGLDPKKTVFWLQSDVPEVLELAYIFGCVTSMGLLERAHSYKDALAKSKVVKSGIFYYPVLMAADILLFDSDLVPVGKDQAQHLEMTRDIATFFNETYEPIFKLPTELISESVGIVPGTDGRKMSKSYDNGIHIFAPEAEVKKQVMAIKTDSKGLAEPKIAEECAVYEIYKVVATSSEAAEMKRKLEAGGYGYGDAKKTLLEKILVGYGPMRKEFERLMRDPSMIRAEQKRGAEKARTQAAKMISRVRKAVGL